MFHYNSCKIRRPHSVALIFKSLVKNNVPKIGFMCAVPERFVGANGIGYRQESILSYHCNLLCNSVASSAGHINSERIGNITHISHGKVAYCGDVISLTIKSTFLLLFVAGEEGNIKTFTYDRSNKFSEIVFQQEVEFPFNRPIKTLQSCSECESNLKGIVVAAGGKLVYSVYRYNTRDFIENSIQGESSLHSRLPLNTFLIPCCSGSTWNKASQDHRILSLSVCSICNLYYLISFCDSRGKVNVYNLHYDACKCDLLIEFDLSSYPILCSTVSTVVFQPDSNPLVSSYLPLQVLGDTFGMIYVLLIGGREKLLAPSSKLLLSYQAHAMGTNSVFMHTLKPLSKEYLSSVLIISGGDDQAISISISNLSAIVSEVYF